MSFVLWNILLAMMWVLATGQFTPVNFLVGYLLGFLVLWFAWRALGPARYFVRAWRAVCLLAYFLKELVIANFRVAHDVVTPTFYMRPALISVPLDAATDAEITLLAGMVTLTPGTLSVDVSPDRKTLLIHAMFGENPEEVRRGIKDGFERRILEILR